MVTLVRRVEGAPAPTKSLDRRVQGSGDVEETYEVTLALILPFAHTSMDACSSQAPILATQCEWDGATSAAEITSLVHS